jgi:hypothetical protein
MEKFFRILFYIKIPILKEMIAVVGTAVGAILATSATIKAIGFGSAGIEAGSKAAVLQAGIGNVASGSWFATLTSIGMTSTLPISIATGGIVCLGYGILKVSKYFIS